MSIIAISTSLIRFLLGLLCVFMFAVCLDGICFAECHYYYQNNICDFRQEALSEAQNYINTHPISGDRGCSYSILEDVNTNGIQVTINKAPYESTCIGSYGTSYLAGWGYLKACMDPNDPCCESTDTCCGSKDPCCGNPCCENPDPCACGNIGGGGPLFFSGE